MVFALAGDSTITSDVEPGPVPSPSSSILGVVFLAFAVATLFVARLAVVFFLVVLAFAILVHRSVVAASGRIFQPRSFKQSAQVVERDTSLELHERALDDVLQLQAVDGAPAVQEQEMPHRFGGQ